MTPRQKNNDTKIVYGTSCTAEVAEKKLAGRKKGSFLLRDSSVEGLITISYINDAGEIRHVRIGLAEGQSGLKWMYAPSDKEKASKFAASARNAFQLLQQYPQSFKALLTLITRLELDMDLMITPLKNEFSNRFGSYTLPAEQWIESPEMERPVRSKRKPGTK